MASPKAVARRHPIKPIHPSPAPGGVQPFGKLIHPGSKRGVAQHAAQHLCRVVAAGALLVFGHGLVSGGAKLGGKHSTHLFRCGVLDGLVIAKKRSHFVPGVAHHHVFVSGTGGGGGNGLVAQPLVVDHRNKGWRGVGKGGQFARGFHLGLADVLHRCVAPLRGIGDTQMFLHRQRDALGLGHLAQGAAKRGALDHAAAKVLAHLGHGQHGQDGQATGRLASHGDVVGVATKSGDFARHPFKCRALVHQPQVGRADAWQVHEAQGTQAVVHTHHHHVVVLRHRHAAVPVQRARPGPKRAAVQPQQNGAACAIGGRGGNGQGQAVFALGFVKVAHGRAQT